MFRLTEDQINQIDQWVHEQNQKVIEEQKKNSPDVPRELLEECWEMGYPYTGAIGGEITYSFTPTSLGSIVRVRHVQTGAELDVTDYDSW